MPAAVKATPPPDPENPPCIIEPCRLAQLTAKAANPHPVLDAQPLPQDPSNLSDLIDLSNNKVHDIPDTLAMMIQGTDEETWVP